MPVNENEPALYLDRLRRAAVLLSTWSMRHGSSEQKRQAAKLVDEIILIRRVWGVPPNDTPEPPKPVDTTGPRKRVLTPRDPDFKLR